MVGALLLSAILDGSSQGLNYVAQVEGGIMLFAIFNSAVTLFACVFAATLFGARLEPLQWGQRFNPLPTTLLACVFAATPFWSPCSGWGQRFI